MQNDADGYWTKFGYLELPHSVTNYQGLSPANTSHTLLLDIGTNSHPDIDIHISASTDPHSENLTQTNLTVTGNLNLDLEVDNSVVNAVVIDGDGDAYIKNDFVDVDNVQTLTNKTISSGDNTITVSAADDTNINELIDQDVRSTSDPVFISVSAGKFQALTVGERKIVLYDEGNDHQYVGFGRDSTDLISRTYDVGSFCFMRGTSASASSEMMKLGRYVFSDLLRIGSDTSSPAITLGSSFDTSGMLIGRSSGTNDYFTGSGSGAMCIKNASGPILLGATTGTTPQIELANNSNVRFKTTILCQHSTADDILMSNVSKDRKIVLYNTQDGSKRFYGMGIGSSTFRFNVDSTNTDYKFYAATGASTENEVFRIKGTGGVQFPNSTVGYTPASLNYYENYEFATTASGPWDSKNCSIYITKIGNMVTLMIPGIGDVRTNNDIDDIEFGAIPERFRPSIWTNYPTVVFDDTNMTGMLVVASDGRILVGKYNNGKYTGTACGTTSIGVSYLIV